MILGHRLKEKREARGLTLEALGPLIAKDAQYIWKLESGRRSGVTSHAQRPGPGAPDQCRLPAGMSDVATLRARATRPAARTRATRRPAARTNGHTSAPAPTAADPPPARMCPHCAMPMQPLGDGARVAVRAVGTASQGDVTDAR